MKSFKAKKARGFSRTEKSDEGKAAPPRAPYFLVNQQPLSSFSKSQLATAISSGASVAYSLAGKSGVFTMPTALDKNVMSYLIRTFEDYRQRGASAYEAPPAAVIEPTLHGSRPHKETEKSSQQPAPTKMTADAKERPKAPAPEPLDPQVSWAQVAGSAKERRAVRRAGLEASAAPVKAPAAAPPPADGLTARERRAARRAASETVAAKRQLHAESQAAQQAKMAVPPELYADREVDRTKVESPPAAPSPLRNVVKPLSRSAYEKSRDVEDYDSEVTRHLLNEALTKDGNIASQAFIESEVVGKGRTRAVDDLYATYLRAFNAINGGTTEGQYRRRKLNETTMGTFVAKAKPKIVPSAVELKNPKQAFADFWLTLPGHLAVVGPGLLDTWRLVSSTRKDVHVVQPSLGIMEASKYPLPCGMSGDPVPDEDLDNPYVRLSANGRLSNVHLRDVTDPHVMRADILVFPDSLDCLDTQDYVWLAHWMLTRPKARVLVGRFGGVPPQTQRCQLSSNLLCYETLPGLSPVSFSYHRHARDGETAKDTFQINDMETEIEYIFRSRSVKVEDPNDFGTSIPTAKYRQLFEADYLVRELTVEVVSGPGMPLLPVPPLNPAFMGTLSGQADFLKRLYAGKPVRVANDRAVPLLRGGCNDADVADIISDFPTLDAVRRGGDEDDVQYAVDFVSRTTSRVYSASADETGDALYSAVDAMFLDEDLEPVAGPPAPASPFRGPGAASPAPSSVVVQSPHGNVSFATDKTADHVSADRAAARAVVSSTPNVWSTTAAFKAVRSATAAAARANKVGMDEVDMTRVADEVVGVNVGALSASATIVSETAYGCLDRTIPGAGQAVRTKVASTRDRITNWFTRAPAAIQAPQPPSDGSSTPRVRPTYRRLSPLAHYWDTHTRFNPVFYCWALVREACRLYLPLLVVFAPFEDATLKRKCIAAAAGACAATNWSVWVDDARRNGYVDHHIPKTRVVTILFSVFATSVKYYLGFANDGR